ncbi:hypothetical protein ES703_105075 [subsurface metagenome]
MGTNFAVGDKVRIVGEIAGDEFIGRTGVIIKDGGRSNEPGVRKLYEGWKLKTGPQQWIVKLDDTGNEVAFFEGALEKI